MLARPHRKVGACQGPEACDTGRSKRGSTSVHGCEGVVDPHVRRDGEELNANGGGARVVEPDYRREERVESLESDVVCEARIGERICEEGRREVRTANEDRDADKDLPVSSSLEHLLERHVRVAIRAGAVDLTLLKAGEGESALLIGEHGGGGDVGSIDKAENDTEDHGHDPLPKKDVVCEEGQQARVRKGKIAHVRS